MNRPGSPPKPRTIADVVAEMKRAFDEARNPQPALPKPPAGAPTPPPPHHDREPGERE